MATPLNDLIRRTTAEYLETVDPANPPSPAVIEEALLDGVNTAIHLENVGRDKSERLSKLKVLTPSQVADVLARVHRVVRVASSKSADPDKDLLAYYNSAEGIYVTSEEAFRSLARRYNYSLTINEFREVLAALKDGAPRVLENDDPNLVPVANGVFNYQTKALAPFSSNLVFTSKLITRYVKNAPKVIIHNPDDGTDWDVETWMAELSDDPEIVQVLWEILGALARRYVRWKRCALLYGERGNNGKGSLAELGRQMVGEENCAVIPIGSFGQDFMLEQLTRASAIIVDENDVGAFTERTGHLKAVITHDPILLNRKHQSAVTYRFRGFMVQCINEIPRFRDKSDSFYRRQLFVPFEKRFEGRERSYIKDDYLQREDVLEYVLHKVLHMPDYYELSTPQACLDLRDQARVANDPMLEFWQEFEDKFSWDLVPFSFLYDLYRAWFDRTHPKGQPVAQRTLTAALVRFCEDSLVWDASQYQKDIRPSGRMTGPEPLIAEYAVEGWMNPARPRDPLKLSLPMLKANYKGLVRRTASARSTSVPQA